MSHSSTMSIARWIVAGVTILWAVACMIGTFLQLGLGDGLAQLIFYLLLFATFFAVTNQRFGGLALMAPGALVVFAMQTPPLFQWGVGLSALILGIATTAVGIVSHWHGHEYP